MPALPAHPRTHPLRPALLLVVAAGGALGSLLRVAVGEAWPTPSAGFPWTTLAINVTGCAALAALPHLAVVRRHAWAPPFLGTGVLGGYTTLSTMSAESVVLADAGHLLAAAAYVVATLGACLVVVALVDRLSRPEERREFDAEEGDL